MHVNSLMQIEPNKYKAKIKTIKSWVLTRDGFELEFSGSSKPELWMFRAEPSRAGTLQFSSWNRAENFLRTTIKFPNFLPVSWL